MPSIRSRNPLKRSWKALEKALKGYKALLKHIRTPLNCSWNPLKLWNSLKCLETSQKCPLKDPETPWIALKFPWNGSLNTVGMPLNSPYSYYQVQQKNALKRLLKTSEATSWNSLETPFLGSLGTFIFNVCSPSHWHKKIPVYKSFCISDRAQLLLWKLLLTKVYC